MALTNGDLEAARASVAEQVKFDILTESHEAVSQSRLISGLATEVSHLLRTMKRQGDKSQGASSVRKIPSVELGRMIYIGP